MQATHLTFAADGRLALFPSEAQRRAAVRAIVRVGGARILLFCLVDDHVHVVVYAPTQETGRLSRALLLAMRLFLAADLAPAHPRPVDNRAHLLWLVRYLLLQPAKHGLAGHPALWSGSCFADLAGARRVPGWAPPIAEALPRWRLREAFALLGLPAASLCPMEDLGDQPPSRLLAAAAFALAVDPALEGRRAEVVRARRVAAALLEEAGHPIRGIAVRLRVDPTSVRRLVSGADPADLRAARMWLALQAAAASPPLVAEPPLDWSTWGDEEER